MGKIKEISDKYLIKTYNRSITIERGEGVYLYDDEGNKYLDFAAGIGVNCLGYGNEKLLNAIIKQAKLICHCSNLYYNGPQAETSRLLVENSCFDKAFFCNSGSEAVEASLKLARKYRKNRPRIVSFNHSFHGRTFGAISVTGNSKYRDEFAPLLPDVTFAEFNNIASVKEVVNDNVCAIIVEPIQGEGGVITATKEFLSELRKMCDEKNIVLIFDEVQCGMGRTGKLFAYQLFGVEPDAACIAKGLGGGFPVGAVLAKKEVAAVFSPGDHGTTYGGNPLAMAVARAALEEIIKSSFLINVNEVGKYLFERLTRIKNNHPIVKDVRGCGLMIGVELAELGDIISKCQKNGLLLAKAGNNTLRFLPPLIATKEHVDEAVAIFEKSL